MRFEIKMPFKIPRNKLGHLKGCICPKCPDYDPVINEMLDKRDKGGD